VTGFTEWPSPPGPDFRSSARTARWSAAACRLRRRSGHFNQGRRPPMQTDRTAAPRSRPVTGFTVIELIITVAVLAILIAVATPSFRELSLNNRTTSATNNLLADLALARNEAVKTARPAFVSARGTWSEGWIVWVDA